MTVNTHYERTRDSLKPEKQIKQPSFAMRQHTEVRISVVSEEGFERIYAGLR